MSREKESKFIQKNVVNRAGVKHSPIRLLLVHQHAIVRRALKVLLEQSSDIRVVGEASELPQALACLDGNNFDVLLTSFTLPGATGKSLVGLLRDHRVEIPILVLAPHAGLQTVQGIFGAGANGYITHDCTEDQLVLAICKVASGGRYLESYVAEQIAFGMVGLVQHEAHYCLTSRELQVLRMLGRGLKVKEIADQLSVSHKTVSAHKARIMKKMGFSSTSEIVSYVMVNSLEH